MTPPAACVPAGLGLILAWGVCAAAATRPAAGGAPVVLPDALLQPGQARTFTVTLPPARARAGPPLKLAAHLVYPFGEAGMAAVLKVAVNGTALGADHHPANKPRTFSMPNHRSHPKKWSLYDAAGGTWMLFYDNDVLPALKSGRYYVAGMDDYLYAFGVGKLWREGANTVELVNTSPRYKVRILSVETHDAALKRAKERFQAVPTDRFLTTCREFPAPKVEQIRKRFLLCHRLMEGVYNGDGSWGKGYSTWSSLNRPECRHPLVRWTGRPVLAYLIAHRVQPDALYLKRAKEGLEWLLKEQTPSGAYKWYWTPGGSVDGNSLYDTAIAGRALAAGHEQFKLKRYLDASAKAARWAMAMPVSGNANYNFFTVWHQAAHYRLTKDKAVLASAVDRAVRTLKNQLPNGMWSDHHNQQINYHSIITRGLVELLSVMPPDHPQREAVRVGAMRAVNHVIAEQAADGSLRKHPYGGAWAGYGTGACFATPALANAHRLLGWKLDGVLKGLAGSPMGIEPDQPRTWDSVLPSLLWWQASAWEWARSTRAESPPSRKGGV